MGPNNSSSGVYLDPQGLYQHNDRTTLWEKSGEIIVSCVLGTLCPCPVGLLQNCVQGLFCSYSVHIIPSQDV